MYSVTVEQSFDSAHFLADYNGKCRNIHGHRWRVVLQLQTQTLCQEGNNRGMCADFHELKEKMKKVLEPYDHTLLIERGSLTKKTMDALREEDFSVTELSFRPTAENFARHFYDLFSKVGLDVACVTVYETPNNCAAYRP